MPGKQHRKRRTVPISLAHLSFEEAVSALVRDDTPEITQTDPPAAASDSTTAADPEPDPLADQATPRQWPSDDPT